MVPNKKWAEESNPIVHFLSKDGEIPRDKTDANKTWQPMAMNALLSKNKVIKINNKH